MKKSITELTREQDLKGLAIESNRRLGRELFKEGRVEITESKPEHVESRVKVSGGEVRKVELEAEDGKLSWTCTCGSASGKNDVFCKHSVATALKFAAPDES